MAITPELIYCANGNWRYAKLAVDAGFSYGAQMPGKIYLDKLNTPLVFIDIHPDNPPLQWRYVSYLRKWKPRFASVHDWHSGRDFTEIMLRAEEIAMYVTESVLIIPKVHGTVADIPGEIGGKRVVLGYSVPTRHGRTDVPVSEFCGREVHLLGGNPHKQVEFFYQLSDAGANVVSTDGNIALKHANRGRFYYPSGDAVAKNRYWPTILEMDGQRAVSDATYEAFKRSCYSIMEMWSSIH